MTRRKFSMYDVTGGVLWVGGVVTAGYFFGSIPWVKDNLAWIVVGIVIVSLLPMTIGYLRERSERRARTPGT